MIKSMKYTHENCNNINVFTTCKIHAFLICQSIWGDSDEHKVSLNIHKIFIKSSQIGGMPDEKNYSNNENKINKRCEFSFFVLTTWLQFILTCVFAQPIIIVVHFFLRLILCVISAQL